MHGILCLQKIYQITHLVVILQVEYFMNDNRKTVLIVLLLSICTLRHYVLVWLHTSFTTLFKEKYSSGVYIYNVEKEAATGRTSAVLSNMIIF